MPTWSGLGLGAKRVGVRARARVRVRLGFGLGVRVRGEGLGFGAHHGDGDDLQAALAAVLADELEEVGAGRAGRTFGRDEEGPLGAHVHLRREAALLLRARARARARVWVRVWVRVG